MGKPTGVLLNNMKLSYLKVSENSHVHAYTSTVTAPTCTEEGYTTHSCSCGDSYTTDRIAPQGHDYSGGLCTVCSEDSVSASLAENILTLTGELDNGTQIVAAAYNISGRLTGSRLLVWNGSTQSEEIPADVSVKLFFADENWVPLRPVIPAG